LSREDFIAVATRLFVVYLAYRIFGSAPAMLQMLQMDGELGWNYWTVSFIVLLVLGAGVCLLLWYFPLTIARKLLPVMHEPRSEKAVDAPVALSIGLTLIGIWVLAYGLVDLTFWMTLWLRTRQQGYIDYQWSPEQIANVVSTGVEIAIGLWLILGNGGLRRLIYRFRYGQA